MRRGPRTATAVAVAAGCLLLSGCTVAQGAVTGVSVAADGSPVGMVLVCKGQGRHIDEAFFRDGLQPGPSHDSWSYSGDITGFSSWPFAGGGGWTASRTFPALKPGVTYSISTWGRGNGTPGTQVDFTVQDLAALTPRTVRWVPIPGDGSAKVSSVADFRAHGCDGTS